MSVFGSLPPSPRPSYAHTDASVYSRSSLRAGLILTGRVRQAAASWGLRVTALVNEPTGRAGYVLAMAMVTSTSTGQLEGSGTCQACKLWATRGSASLQWSTLLAYGLAMHMCTGHCHWPDNLFEAMLLHCSQQNPQSHVANCLARQLLLRKPDRQRTCLNLSFPNYH